MIRHSPSASCSRFFDRYEGAIFDLDGTLLDSMGVWEEIDREWLAAQGGSAEEAADFFAAVRDMTAPQAAAFAARRFGLSLAPEEIVRQWEAMCLEKYRLSVPLKPGAAELLAGLRRRGFPLALATSCFPAACEAALERLGVRGHFAALVYANGLRRRDGAPADKSGSEVWLAAAEALGVPPERCVVFEDLHAALKGARAAGMGFVAVHDPSCPDWPALAAKADLAALSLTELRV
ncbi:MAG: beta-phosphoglucomutase [Treponematales bacterium]